MYLRYANIDESMRHVIDFVPLHIQIDVIKMLILALFVADSYAI